MYAEKTISAALLAMVGVLYPMTHDFSDGSDVFPKFILVSVGILAMMLLISSFRRNVPAKESRSVGSKPYILLLSTTAYIFAINVVGFFTSTIIFLTATMHYLGIRTKTSYFIMVASLSAFYYFIFVRLLHVPLPQGFLF